MPQPLKPQSSKSVETALAESDEAVYSLLESLLQEVEEAPAEPLEKLQTTVVEPIAEQLVVEPVKVFTETPIQQEEVTETQLEEVIESSLPDWTQQPFSCLLFDVEGVELAVPLPVLRSIDVWRTPALPMPAQPDWHLGVMKHRDENIVIVDTARVIMPEKVTESPEYRRKHHGSHFLVIDSQWAFSCNAIKETIKISPEQVRWRPQRPNRNWAVGTLIDRLCILMDTEALIKQIESEQK